MTTNDFLNPVTTQTWSNGRHMVRCVKVIQETWDVRTFCFMADQPVLYFFKPGQFVTLELEIDGQPFLGDGAGGHTADGTEVANDDSRLWQAGAHAGWHAMRAAATGRSAARWHRPGPV